MLPRRTMVDACGRKTTCYSARANATATLCSRTHPYAAVIGALTSVRRISIVSTSAREKVSVQNNEKIHIYKISVMCSMRIFLIVRKLLPRYDYTSSRLLQGWEKSIPGIWLASTERWQKVHLYHHLRIKPRMRQRWADLFQSVVCDLREQVQKSMWVYTYIMQN